jgi:hypothetical protein
MANFRAWISYHERMISIVFILLLIFLLFVRFVWFGETTVEGNTDSVAVTRSILNGLISALVVTAVVALVLRYTSPPREAAGSTSYIQSNDIDGHLRAGAIKTKEWTYYGHTGRYVRSAIFPILLDQARRGRAIHVRMLILDPSDDRLCEYYARYRDTTRTARRGPQWSKDTVKSELLATVFTAMELRALSPAINMEIGFVKHVSLFRLDLATDRVLITQEDAHEPALGYDSDSRFYDYYRRDATMALDQARRLKQLDSTKTFLLTDQPSCTIELAASGLDLSAFSESVVTDAFKRARERINPYE